MEPPQVYEPSTDGAIRQGEVLSSVYQLTIELVDQAGHVVQKARPLKHPFAIVLSQDCDLDWDYGSRMAREPETHQKIVPSVLFCEVAAADTLKSQRGMNMGTWKKIRQNVDPRYQFIESCPDYLDALKRGFPDLAMDFKRFYTVPTQSLYSDLNTRTERCARLVGPYLRQLITRFYHFQLRVALPREHGSKN